MAALTEKELDVAADKLADLIFRRTGREAHSNRIHCRDAVSSIDDFMNARFSDVPAGWETKTIRQGLLDAMAEPFKSKSNAEEKELALSVWSATVVAQKVL